MAHIRRAAGRGRERGGGGGGGGGSSSSRGGGHRGKYIMGRRRRIEEIFGRRRTVVPGHDVIEVDLEHWRVQADGLAKRIAIDKALAVTKSADELPVLDACGHRRLAIRLVGIAALLVGVENATLVEFHRGPAGGWRLAGASTQRKGGAP
jgi:hypothetical protein